MVENAIKHGLEPQVHGGSITVRASHDGSRLTLDVLDTGVGLGLDQAGMDGFGLTQVRERLRSKALPVNALPLLILKRR